MAEIAGELASVGVRTFLARPLPASRWRRRAREALREIVATIPRASVPEMLTAADKAYPFGPREHHPYRMWREEIKLLEQDLLAEANVPTAEEWSAIEVAIDMIEAYRMDDGTLALPDPRAAEIRAYLDEQAPRRHARPCRVCGAALGKPCREAAASTVTLSLAHTLPSVEFFERLIPHTARVQP